MTQRSSTEHRRQGTARIIDNTFPKGADAADSLNLNQHIIRDMHERDLHEYDLLIQFRLIAEFDKFYHLIRILSSGDMFSSNVSGIPTSSDVGDWICAHWERSSW